MRRPTRPKIVWKDKVTVTDPDFLLPPPYQKEYELQDATMEEKLVIGRLFRTTAPLMPLNMTELTPKPRYKRHAYSYLIETHYSSKMDSRIFDPGSIAVYTGIVRVEETKKDQTVRLLRHTFIISGQRFMTLNLNLFKPL